MRNQEIEEETYVCCLCGVDGLTFVQTRNPAPVPTGMYVSEPHEEFGYSCCGECDRDLVLPLRLALITGRMNYDPDEETFSDQDGNCFILKPLGELLPGREESV